MRLLIAGGGTGGHLYPGIALAREWERRVPGTRVTFVGTARGLETRVVPAEGYELKLIRVSGIAGLGIMDKIRSAMKIPSGLYQSFRLLRELSPDFVIGVGGYSSGPVVLMAWFMAVPRVLVEPNAYPGWTNRVLAPFALRIFTAFRSAERHLRPGGRIRCLGNPVRREIAAGGSEDRTDRRTTLLIMGGSQGAHSINRAMVEALGPLESLRKSVRIIHQTGDRDREWVEKAYRDRGYEATIAPFLSNMPEIYRSCDLAVCRAGATTIAELTARGVPAVLVPFPHAAHGHQTANAEAMAGAGAATILPEEKLNGATLASEIHRLATDSIRLHEMARNSRSLGRPDAAERIITECLGLPGVRTTGDHVQ